MYYSLKIILSTGNLYITPYLILHKPQNYTSNNFYLLKNIAQFKMGKGLFNYLHSAADSSEFSGVPVPLMKAVAPLAVIDQVSLDFDST